MPSDVSLAGAHQDHEPTIRELMGELAEAREQQAATAEILKVISSSPMDLRRGVGKIANRRARLCDAYDAAIHQVDGDALPLVAHHGPVHTLDSLPLARGVVAGRAILDRQTIHVADLQAERDEYPEGSDNARRLGFRTNLTVPLIRAGTAIGVISIRRPEARLFSDKQVALLQVFADQAVIAIENARLFEAEQASKRELQESLEFQTAMSDVLGVISRSPSDLQPVLQAIVETAARLCQADFADFRLLQAGLYRVAATTADEAVHVRNLRNNPIAPGRGSVVGRTALERRTVHVPDAQADSEYTFAVELGPVRTLLGVPLVRDDVAVGVIVLFNRIVRPFTQKQIALVTTFADQALIAIENTRLFEEVQARTKELQDSLDRQTATSEVLGVISRSPNEVQPVLDTIVATAQRLCQAERAIVWRLEGETFRAVAHHGLPEGRVESYLE